MGKETKKPTHSSILRGVVARMMREYFVTQAGAVDVDVDFGGGDALVAKHLLDSTQVAGLPPPQRQWQQR